jgi:hypothetical protein
MSGHAVHDTKNAELGKPILYPKDLLRFKRDIDRALAKCQNLGSCPPSPRHTIAKN